MQGGVYMYTDIVGFDNYAIDESGNVLSKSRQIIDTKGHVYMICERILKPTVNKKSGYVFVGLRKDNKTYNLYVHRLVAETFIPNPNNYPTVNHKDGNKQNNSVENLEWCSYSDNNQHAYDTGLHKRGSAHYLSKLTEDDVIRIKSMYFVDNVSIPEICKQFQNVVRATIYDIINGESWKHIKL
jgi:hypothetical protein